ncbi:MAG: S8 family serine peptidase, partial [Gammaproteobacteria bacterium]|nr:S8 family serine peptidase [Gammaproteobacteria bacterium]
TSMAAPHVSGVLALMKAVNPGLSPADIDALLIRGELSDDLGVPGRDNEYGYGLINAQRAVLAALEAGGATRRKIRC